jgi:hypothetical protein
MRLKYPALLSFEPKPETCIPKIDNRGRKYLYFLSKQFKLLTVGAGKWGKN